MLCPILGLQLFRKFPAMLAKWRAPRGHVIETEEGEGSQKGSLAAATVVVAFVAISLSRSAAMYKGYHAPMDVYAEVAKLNPAGPARTLCVGKESKRHAPPIERSRVASF